MATITVTRRLEWDAMHRIPNHEGQCKTFHGHRYVAEIRCSAPDLDELGRVIDFGVIKTVIGKWIDENWDHTAILSESDPDPATKQIIDSNEKYGKPVYLMSEIPTVENITAELANTSQKLLQDTPVTVTMIRVWETPNCSATWKK